MTGSPTGRRVAGLVLGGLLAGLALTGCTSPPAPTSTPSPEVTSAAPTPSTSVSASTTPTPSPSQSSAADALTIDITIADGQVTPNGEKMDVAIGQTVVLNVTSDEDDEVHAHTEGDGFELAVTAGRPATGEFTLNSPGSYEVESHHLEKVIVILNAR